VNPTSCIVPDDLDTDKYINDNTESDHKVTLSENDHQDLVEIFKNRFPDCSLRYIFSICFCMFIISYQFFTVNA
jgi:hypothetical protein